MVILEIKGKQYPAEEGDTLRVDRIGEESEQTCSDIKVLYYRNGNQVRVGTPYLEDIKVIAKLGEEFRDKKVRVVHYKPKKDIRSLRGHRQTYTNIKIEKIQAS